jgi:pimeloyl-ACP methyl ester carboxylesterase
MSTHQTAKTHFVDAASTTFAYRRLGPAKGVPVLCLIHFRGTMDHWDPLLINSLASTRPVILVDYAGIGQSKGRVAATFKDSAHDILAFLAAIEVVEVDILGFSIGGFVAQMVALENSARNSKTDGGRPKLQIHHLVIAGSSASVGPDMPASDNDYVPHATAAELEVAHFKTLFFAHNAEGEAAAESWWVRMQERSQATSGEARSAWASQGLLDGGEAMKTQAGAYAAFQDYGSSRGEEGTYDRLGLLDLPVLVAQGSVSLVVFSFLYWFASFFVFSHSSHTALRVEAWDERKITDHVRRYF